MPLAVHQEPSLESLAQMQRTQINTALAILRVPVSTAHIQRVLHQSQPTVQAQLQPKLLQEVRVQRRLRQEVQLQPKLLQEVRVQQLRLQEVQLQPKLLQEVHP
jgi:hypothetical protein